MACTEKFQQRADAARTRVVEVAPDQVDALVAAGAIALPSARHQRGATIAS